MFPQKSQGSNTHKLAREVSEFLAAECLFLRLARLVQKEAGILQESKPGQRLQSKTSSKAKRGAVFVPLVIFLYPTGSLLTGVITLHSKFLS